MELLRNANILIVVTFECETFSKRGMYADKTGFSKLTQLVYIRNTSNNILRAQYFLLYALSWLSCE
jgi:hypothetical protein